MLAVVEIQGKQYVITDKTSFVETDSFKDAKEGEKIVIDKVLIYQENDDSETEFGMPYVEGKKLEFEIASQEKGKKVYGIKFKRRHRYLKRVNHRQIKAKLTLAGKKAPVKKAAPKKDSVKKPVAKKTAPKKETK